MTDTIDYENLAKALALTLWERSPHLSNASYDNRTARTVTLVFDAFERVKDDQISLSVTNDPYRAQVLLSPVPAVERAARIADLATEIATNFPTLTPNEAGKLAEDLQTKLDGVGRES